MQYAALYKSGIDGIFFNKKIFWGWVTNAFYHGTIVFIFGCWSLDSAAPDGGVLGMYTWGAASFWLLAIVTNLKLALEQASWGWWNVLFISLELIAFPIMVGFCSSLGIEVRTPELTALCLHPGFWFGMVATVVVALGRDLYWKGWLRRFFPRFEHMIEHSNRFPEDGWNLEVRLSFKRVCMGVPIPMLVPVVCKGPNGMTDIHLEVNPS